MIEFASVIRQALDLWHNPPYTELSVDAITDAGNRVLSQHSLDLDLTPDACFFTQYSDTFSFFEAVLDREVVEVSVDDISRITRVESRDSSSTNDADWQEESVTSFENWNDVMERTDGNYVAFYGLPSELHMVVNRDVSNLTFRIVCKVLNPKLSVITEVIDMPAYYEALLVYDLALEFGELIDNLSPEFTAKKAAKIPSLMLRRKDAHDRLDKWRRSQKGLSVTTRRAFNDRNANTSSRKFTARY